MTGFYMDRNTGLRLVNYEHSNTSIITNLQVYETILHGFAEHENYHVI